MTIAFILTLALLILTNLAWLGYYIERDDKAQAKENARREAQQKALRRALDEGFTMHQICEWAVGAVFYEPVDPERKQVGETFQKGRWVALYEDDLTLPGASPRGFLLQHGLSRSTSVVVSEETVVSVCPTVP